MKLIYEIIVFPLTTTLSLYLISNLFVEALIRGQRFNRGGCLFQDKENTLYQIPKLCFCLFQQWKLNKKPQNQKKKKKKEKKKKKNKTSQYQQ